MMMYAAFEAGRFEEINKPFTPDRAAATMDAKKLYRHLTVRERAATEVSVRGWNVPEGMTFDEWTEDLCFVPDPVVYDVIEDD